MTTLALDDPKTYEMLQRGDSIGVFQFESEGMREALKKVGPTEFDDLVALVALYRPGAMDQIRSDVVNPQLNRGSLVHQDGQDFGVIVGQIVPDFGDMRPDHIGVVEQPLGGVRHSMFQPGGFSKIGP